MGIFLDLIEMLAEFDPIVQENVSRITNDNVHVHFLGHKIQNELILLLDSTIKNEIIRKIKQAKYFSVILDCTLSVSHQEQMSLIIRYMSVSSNSVSVEESFLRFLNVNDTTGQELFDVLQDELKNLDLDIFDVRGQGYDNESNNVKWLTPKSLLSTRWESHVDSVKAIKTQMSDFREALLEVSEKDLDSNIRSIAKSLATNELGDFEFLISIIIWFEILSAINVVSKLLQSRGMIIDVTIETITWLILFFKEYREIGFINALNYATKFVLELNIDPVFPQMRIIRRKMHFDENLNTPPIKLFEEEFFRVNYYFYLVDQAIVSLNKIFEQYQQYQSVFGFLLTSQNLQSLDNATLESCCSHFEETLKHNEQCDIDGKELCVELRLLRDILLVGNIGPIDILRFLKVASAEISFSKLLLKSSLRSTMLQERLNGLTLIAIENDLLDNIQYEDLIEDFASKNARRETLF
ncbi:uncharacterized protein LOC127108524 [Lathyrus oleraceus]|uniref:uncharacterized protein LOC127108524 n=1 Tax=Pisum sativum TaxID=3888 RepID=UPI0021D1DC95|nr:uncharacterized protein LOC127108524 [Pisum sativum]